MARTVDVLMKLDYNVDGQEDSQVKKLLTAQSITHWQRQVVGKYPEPHGIQIFRNAVKYVEKNLL